jgi:hypothetical protein
MPRQHVVVLSPEERDRLRALLRRDATTALQHRRARILLAAESRAGYPVQTDVAVATAVGVDARTVARVRAAFARDGLERALSGRQRVFPPRRMLDSGQRARSAGGQPGLLGATARPRAMDVAAAGGAPSRAGGRPRHQS